MLWDKEDYIKEAEKQFGNTNVYEEVHDDSEPLIGTIHRTVEKNRKKGDLKKGAIKYIEVKDPKIATFSLLPKIHKRLNNVPDRPAISNCGYYTKNISVFLDFHLQPLTKAVKSFIKDTNNFLNKFCSLSILSDNIILSTVYVVVSTQIFRTRKACLSLGSD